MPSEVAVKLLSLGDDSSFGGPELCKVSNEMLMSLMHDKAAPTLVPLDPDHAFDAGLVALR